MNNKSCKIKLINHKKLSINKKYKSRNKKRLLLN